MEASTKAHRGEHYAACANGRSGPITRQGGVYTSNQKECNQAISAYSKSIHI